MRHVMLFILCAPLFSCAVPETVPSKWDVCIDVICPPKTSCYPGFNEEALCLSFRPPAGYCEVPCPIDQECRFDRCISPNLSGNTCEFDDACYLQEVCIQGYCTGMVCEPGEAYPCYTGPVGTLGVGECHGGVYLCEENRLFSRTTCTGEIIPTEEVGLLACNGKDDNCDGITDAGALEKVDLVFAFDVSGSMSDKIVYVADAIEQTAAMYNSPSIHMGLVIFPAYYKYSAWEPYGLIPLQEYATFNTTMNLFANVIGLTSGGGNEASWDIVPMLIDGQVENFALREDAKLVVIMYTDEEGQSWLENTEDTMCAVVRENNVSLYVITLTSFFENFDGCSSTFPLVTNSGTMKNYLKDIVQDVCR